MAVVVSFFICWVPFHAQRLLASYLAKDENQNQLLLDIYLKITYISGVMYYLSSTINPLLYQLMSAKFRLAFKETFKCSLFTCALLCGRRKLTDASSTLGAAPTPNNAKSQYSPTNSVKESSAAPLAGQAQQAHCCCCQDKCLGRPASGRAPSCATGSERPATDNGQTDNWQRAHLGAGGEPPTPGANINYGAGHSVAAARRRPPLRSAFLARLFRFSNNDKQNSPIGCPLAGAGAACRHQCAGQTQPAGQSAGIAIACAHSLARAAQLGRHHSRGCGSAPLLTAGASARPTFAGHSMLKFARGAGGAASRNTVSCCEEDEEAASSGLNSMEEERAADEEAATRLLAAGRQSPGAQAARMGVLIRATVEPDADERDNRELMVTSADSSGPGSSHDSSPDGPPTSTGSAGSSGARAGPRPSGARGPHQSSSAASSAGSTDEYQRPVLNEYQQDSEGNRLLLLASGPAHQEPGPAKRRRRSLHQPRGAAQPGAGGPAGASHPNESLAPIAMRQRRKSSSYSTATTSTGCPGQAQPASHQGNKGHVWSSLSSSERHLNNKLSLSTTTTSALDDCASFTTSNSLQLTSGSNPDLALAGANGPEWSAPRALTHDNSDQSSAIEEDPATVINVSSAQRDLVACASSPRLANERQWA